MNNIKKPPRHLLGVLIMGIFLLGSDYPLSAQFHQEINVTIEGYAFHTTQMPLQLHAETLINIKNLDKVRHDFSSQMFLDTLTHVEGNGAVAYGKGVEGVYIDPGQEATIRLTIDHPGRFQFQCSIHKDMKGEILLLTVDAV